MTTVQTKALKNLQHFVSIDSLGPETVRVLLDCAVTQKRLLAEGKLKPSLERKTLAMIFQKPSLRTRLSFEVAMTQLGGHAVNLDDHHVGMGHREAVSDVARVVSGMCDGIMARVFDHKDVETLARHASVPVINGLTDWSHPCQAMADAMTLIEHFNRLEGRRVAFVGDGNNVARSLAMVCGKLNMQFALASPPGYGLSPKFVEQVMSHNATMDFLCTPDPVEAVRNADVVYADTWTSMGHESEKDMRAKAFRSYQINVALLAHAKPTAVVMHCLPASRGREITDDVLDGPQSVVFQQSQNRLHFQRALLDVLIGNRQGLAEGAS